MIEAIDNFTTARGTAIGSAILTSIDGIAAINPTVAPSGVDAESAQRSGYASDVIVVLTDGANTQGVEPATAAEAAAVRGVRVFTIGFGTTTPSRMACTGRQAGGWAGGGQGGGPGGGFGGGGRNPRIIDEPSLQAVAEITGGQYYKAESADQLQDALGDLPSQVTVVTEARRHRFVVRRRRRIARCGRRRALAVVEPGTRTACSALRDAAGLLRALIESEGRVFVAHEGDVDQHAVEPTVDAHEQVEQTARVRPSDQQEEAGEDDEQVDH